MKGTMGSHLLDVCLNCNWLVGWVQLVVLDKAVHSCSSAGEVHEGWREFCTQWLMREKGEPNSVKRMLN